MSSRPNPLSTFAFSALPGSGGALGPSTYVSMGASVVPSLDDVLGLLLNLRAFDEVIAGRLEVAIVNVHTDRALQLSPSSSIDASITWTHLDDTMLSVRLTLSGVTRAVPYVIRRDSYLGNIISASVLAAGGAHVVKVDLKLV